MNDPTPQAAWDAADLEPRLCRALDLAKRVVASFAADGYVDSEAPANSFHPEKPVAETAMLIYAASSVRHLPSVAARVAEVAELLVPHARSAQTLLSMALHPALCLDLAVPHILLSKLGFIDPRVDDFLRCCLASQVRNGRERPAFGSLEEQWIEGRWTDTEPGPIWYRHLHNSILSRPLYILGGSRDDGYAFTHVLMYVTDFGFRPASLPRDRSVILEEASSLLAKTLDDEDYDLAGEVLLTWPFLGTPWSATAAFGFRVLASVEDRAGLLPGGTTKLDRLNKLQGKEKRAIRAGDRLPHRLRDGFPLRRLAANRKSAAKANNRAGFAEDFVDRLLASLDWSQGHWQPQLMELTEAERNALCPLLLDLALVQKCRLHDYQAANDLLMSAYQCGVVRSPLCAQSAELLERLAAYSRIGS